MKYLLAIETSCDDTSISILQGIEVISLKTFSQIKFHAKTGGVIPETASRLHSEHIFSLIEMAIEDAGITIDQIDEIAVTKGPGLVNTLQIGITVAKTLAHSLNKPLYGINHIEAHAYSPFINKPFSKIPKKALVVIASGGHTEILIKNGWSIKRIGSTVDDSIGEAYDKVAKLYKLGYPGGPIIDKIYQDFEGEVVKAPVSKLDKYKMSYSGLKSDILKKYKAPNLYERDAVLCGFQEAAVEQLIRKIKKAISEYEIKEIMIGGGVSANSLLREELNKLDDVFIHLPRLKHTGDNAAMIGYLARIKIDKKQITEENLKMDANPRWEI